MQKSGWGARLALIAKGFCIGAADIVPGVSGGTLAFILGIYPRLINAIKSFDGEWLRSLLRLDIKGALGRPHFGFLLPLGAGAGCALLFFTRVVPLPALLRTRPEIIYGLFFGLILGSIILLCRHLGAHILRWQTLFLPAGLLLGAFVVTLAPASTPDHGWFIFLCGAIAISAMILPGLSGSFILLMLKKYAYIFNALGHFDLSVIIPFVLGILSGLALFSRFLSWLLDRFYQQTLLFITGLLIASLYAVWPFQHRVYETVREKARLIASTPYWPAHYDEQALYAGLMLLLGLGLVILLDRLAGAGGMIKTRAG